MGSIKPENSRSGQAFLNRDYDSELGRFLQCEPEFNVGMDNLYGYVNNNPVNYTDITGLCGQALGKTPGNVSRDLQSSDVNPAIIQPAIIPPNVIVNIIEFVYSITQHWNEIMTWLDIIQEAWNIIKENWPQFEENWTE